ncbi:MAG: hypothetical protein PVG65_03425 [Candidatus Thorarchaeota archaeon]|jgi:hypothetical protein
MSKAKKIIFTFIYILTFFSLVCTGIKAEPKISPPEKLTYKLIVVNNNPKSYIYMTRYILDEKGLIVETKFYYLWNEHIRVFELEPGTYDLSQCIIIEIPFKNGMVEFERMIGYRSFKIENKDLRIVMEE